MRFSMILRENSLYFSKYILVGLGVASTIGKEK